MYQVLFCTCCVHFLEFWTYFTAAYASVHREFATPASILRNLTSDFVVIQSTADAAYNHTLLLMQLHSTGRLSIEVTAVTVKNILKAPSMQQQICHWHCHWVTWSLSLAALTARPFVPSAVRGELCKSLNFAELHLDEICFARAVNICTFIFCQTVHIAA